MITRSGKNNVHHSNGNNPDKEEDLIIILRMVIHMGVRVMAILMTAVVLWGVVDIFYVLYNKLMTEPYLLLTIEDILGIFGAFMAVLIAIEIFINITIYLREDVIHVKIVMATALMAIARKVIVLNSDDISPGYLMGIAALVLAMSFGYYLVVVQDHRDDRPNH